jgi:hypothetical protein
VEGRARVVRMHPEVLSNKVESCNEKKGGEGDKSRLLAH